MPLWRRRQDRSRPEPKLVSEESGRAQHHLDELRAFLGDIRKLLATMPSLPPADDTISNEPPGGEAKDGPITMDSYTADPAFRDWLTARTEDLPDGLLSCFLSLSGNVAMILKANGLRTPEIGDQVIRALIDPRDGPLLQAASELEQEASERGKPSRDYLGLRGALWHEIKRRGVARTCILAKTVTTLLGDDALIWLSTESSRGSANVQPHEFARTGWHRLWDIRTQMQVERELLSPSAEDQPYVKIAVASCWAMAAIASHIHSAIFVGENFTHVGSDRKGRYTVASGVGSHIIPEFEAESMRTVLTVIEQALAEDLITAADLMWMASALVKVRKWRVRHVEPEPSSDDRFSLFLSHRGSDAKRRLALRCESLPDYSGIFLDCLTLPRGTINRHFVYRSLAQSDSILIVRTPNFDESPWCRKERWLAGVLADLGLVSVIERDLAEAEDYVARADAGARRRADPGHTYPMVNRILRDLTYWARAPNLHSAEKTDLAVHVLNDLKQFLENGEDPAAQSAQTAEYVKTALEALVEAAPDPSPTDLWCAALQMCVAAFGFSASVRSKDDARAGIDDLNEFVYAFIEKGLHRDPEFASAPASYLAVVAGAATLQMADFVLDASSREALSRAIGDRATLAGGIILLDSRGGGATRRFRLRLAVELLRANIGAIGIVQDAADEVHQMVVDGLPLDVLPCVTLHPGMSAPV